MYYLLCMLYELDYVFPMLGDIVVSTLPCKNSIKFYATYELMRGCCFKLSLTRWFVKHPSVWLFSVWKMCILPKNYSRFDSSHLNLKIGEIFVDIVYFLEVFSLPVDILRMTSLLKYKTSHSIPYYSVIRQRCIRLTVSYNFDFL